MTVACEPCEGHGVRVVGIDVIRCRTCAGTGNASPEDCSSPGGRHVARGT